MRPLGMSRNVVSGRIHACEGDSHNAVLQAEAGSCGTLCARNAATLLLAD